MSSLPQDQCRRCFDTEETKKANFNHLFYSHSSVNTNRKFYESYFFSLWDVDFWVALQSLSSRIITNHKTDTLYNNTNKLTHRKTENLQPGRRLVAWNPNIKVQSTTLAIVKLV